MSLKKLIISVIDTFIIAATTSSITAWAWYYNFSKNFLIVLSFVVIILLYNYLNYKGKQNEQN